MRRYSQSGFTLVELMVVVSIMTILLVIAVPEFRNLMASRAVLMQASELSAFVRKARIEAQSRGASVTVCRTADPMVAMPACAGGGALGWASGWIMFMDRNDNAVVDANDVIIQVRQAYDNSGGIQATPSDAMTFLRAGGKLGGGVHRFIFRPKLETTDPNYDLLSRTVCVGVSGSEYMVQGVAC